MYSKSNLWKIRSLIVLGFVICTNLGLNAKTVCNETTNEQYIIDQAGHKQIIPSMMCVSINDEVVNTLVTDDLVDNLTTNSSVNEQVRVNEVEEKLKVEVNILDVLEKENTKKDISTQVNMTEKRVPNKKSENSIKLTGIGIIVGACIVFIFRRKYIYEKN